MRQWPSSSQRFPILRVYVTLPISETLPIALDCQIVMNKRNATGSVFLPRNLENDAAFAIRLLKGPYRDSLRIKFGFLRRNPNLMRRGYTPKGIHLPTERYEYATENNLIYSVLYTLLPLENGQALSSRPSSKTPPPPSSLFLVTSRADLDG